MRQNKILPGVSVTDEFTREFLIAVFEEALEVVGAPQYAPFLDLFFGLPAVCNRVF